MMIRHFISIICLTAVLSACASTPKKPVIAPEFKNAEKLDNVEKQGTDSLSKRVLKGATQTTVRAAKGAAGLTVGGAQLAAKGAALGVKASGEVIVGTGKIVAKGTRGTARGVGRGMDYLFTAPAVKDAANPVGNKTLTDAALSPLSDFNIRKRERPEVLMELEAESLYYVDDKADCEWLGIRVAELDEALGADYDAKETSSSALDKMGKAGKSAMLSEVASTVGTNIPGRSMIRSVSGAKARQKQTREIYQKGVARRSYLKGIAASQGCEGF